jgi:hypothetical protein
MNIATSEEQPRMKPSAVRVVLNDHPTVLYCIVGPSLNIVSCGVPRLLKSLRGWQDRIYRL